MISMGEPPTLLDLETGSHVVFRCFRRIDDDRTHDDLFNWYVRQLSDDYQIVKVNFRLGGRGINPPVVMQGDIESNFIDARRKITDLLIGDHTIELFGIESPSGNLARRLEAYHLARRLEAYHEEILHGRDSLTELKRVAGYGRF